MFGLSRLMKLQDPHTTVQKFLFLAENVWTHANALSLSISFGALGTLIVFRWFKSHFQKTWWIYRLPEVLIVVAISTIMSREFRWDQGGVDILGAVSVSTGEHFIQWPLGRGNFKFVRETTSTAA
jgi:MFS superfamily sulfate permease-like transporter